MARNINDTIESVFRATYTCSSGTGGSVEATKKRVYMEIPINKPVFEVPVLTFNTFLKAATTGCEAIVVELRTEGRIPRYVTLSRYMKDILYADYENGLVKATIKLDNNAGLRDYYVTHGMVLDEEFTPIAMFSWQIERVFDENHNIKYKFLRPVLRVDSYSYLYKEDAMQKFIINKLPAATLNTRIYYPSCTEVSNLFLPSSHLTVRTSVKVEIDSCPFVLKHTATPSISTTNDELLQVAADHIDEMIA